MSVQPGWFPGHSKALIYINIGIEGEGDRAPPNMSHPIIDQPFQITGPNNSEYGGQFCIPQLRMPTNVSLSVGQNITLQVVETAQHGAALYSVSTHKRQSDEENVLKVWQCVDLTLVPDDSDEYEEVTPENCYNSSNIGFNLMYTSQELTANGETSAAQALAAPASLFVGAVMAGLWAML